MCRHKLGDFIKHTILSSTQSSASKPHKFRLSSLGITLPFCDIGNSDRHITFSAVPMFTKPLGFVSGSYGSLKIVLNMSLMLSPEASSRPLRDSEVFLRVIFDLCFYLEVISR